MNTQKEVDRAFEILKNDIVSHKRTTTGVEDVLRYLLENPHKIWHMSWELIGKRTNSGDYLSHRAPARASDLAIHSPLLVEHRKISRFSAYRLRTENMELVRKAIEKNV